MDMKKTLVLAWLLAWFMAWISTGVLAAAPASTPFMPTWSQRHQLQRLVDEAGLALPMTHWPLPAEVVRRLNETLGAVLAAPDMREKLAGERAKTLKRAQELTAKANFDEAAGLLRGLLDERYQLRIRHLCILYVPT